MNDVQERYYQERIDDLQDVVMDLIATYAMLISELRTEIDLSRAERSKQEAMANADAPSSLDGLPY